jgi:hypothetical protein
LPSNATPEQRPIESTTLHSLYVKPRFYSRLLQADVI